MHAKKNPQNLVSNLKVGCIPTFSNAAPSTRGPCHAKRLYSAVTHFLRTCTEYFANKINCLFNYENKYVIPRSSKFPYSAMIQQLEKK
jgi:hypothetical protein